MSPKVDHLLLASLELGPTLKQWKFYFASQLIRCSGLNYIRTDLARGVGAEEVWTGSDVPCHILNAPLHRASEMPLAGIRGPVAALWQGADPFAQSR